MRPKKPKASRNKKRNRTGVGDEEVLHWHPPEANRGIGSGVPPSVTVSVSFVL